MDHFLTQRLLQAVALAARVHGPMKRKGDGLPFLVHPMAVFGLLARWGCSEDTCVAGLLHDVLEDAPEADKPALRIEMEQTFGPHLLEIIDPITEDESIEWVRRKEVYRENLLKAPQETAFVSCADQTHNTQSLLMALQAEGEIVWSRFTAPKQVKIEQMTLICEQLGRQLGGTYTEELAQNLREIAQFL